MKRFKKGDRVFALTGMRFGAYAEYTCLPEDGVVAIKPANVTYEEAAAVPMEEPLHCIFLEKEISGTDKKFLSLELQERLALPRCSLPSILGQKLPGYAVPQIWWKQFDIIFDAVGKNSKANCKKALAPNGKYVTVDGQGIAKVRSEDLIFLKELIETEKIKSVIDRRYRLEQIPEAHGYVETGRKKGNVVITLEHANKI